MARTETPADGGEPTAQAAYHLRISRLTVDKLGVKLYDKASAVVAELIANAYDADAENVRVRLPLATELARKDGDNVVDHGYTIEVEDDGHGMTPEEAQRDYLEVGRDRRQHAEQGASSREKGRAVMGRKGIGKLAPFGICTRIEVISSGGERTDQGFLTTHFFMDFDQIVRDADEDVPLEVGDLDGTFREARGTTVRLNSFLPRRVPSKEIFMRQVARRFALAAPGFEILVEDTRDPETNPPETVPAFQVATMEGTRVELDERPVPLEDGTELPVKGWLGYAKEAYKNEEMAGVRVYARGKIVATTRDFEQPAGFTGEFTTRSYLVGEVHAEWLDEDVGEDLIRTDRQDILWDSELGDAFRKWGAEIIREIGARSRKPRRERVSKSFLEKSDLERLARERFDDESVVEAALELGEQIGSFAAEDELEDDAYVKGLRDVILTVAPHRALISAFQAFSREALGEEPTLETLADLFSKTRVAEMASYSQIAAERVKVIGELEELLLGGGDVNEGTMQEILAKAPYLIDPSWSVISENQALRTFKRAFEAYWKERTGEDVVLAISHETKRPDFTLVNAGHQLHIVEIKAPGHVFSDDDFARLHNYAEAFKQFMEDNPELRTAFARGWVIDLVADSVELSGGVNKTAYAKLDDDDDLRRTSWTDFMHRAQRAHELFLEVAARTRDTPGEDGDGQ